MTKESGAGSWECRLLISLELVPSKIGTGGGKEIPFTRGMLSVRNIGQTVVSGLVPYATLGQEGGSVQNVSAAFSNFKTPDSIKPGEAIEWDVYDQLIAAHTGAASKIHMFGYRAVLNWWFELVAWAEYRCPDIATPFKTPTSRWKIRWSRPRSPMDEVDLYIEVVKD